MQVLTNSDSFHNLIESLEDLEGEEFENDMT